MNPVLAIAVRAAQLLRLPAADRRALVRALRAEGLRQREIAALLGCSMRTITRDRRHAASALLQHQPETVA
jgi:DNA-directed RNA polymerase specialized sigma24 family protein